MVEFLRSSVFTRTHKQRHILRDGWKSDSTSKRQIKLRVPEIQKKTKKDNFCSVSSRVMNKNNEYPFGEGVVRLMDDIQLISSQGESVQIGNVRTSPKIFFSLFHHRNYSTYEITSSSIHFLSTVPSPFSHLFKSSLLSNRIDHYPPLLLIFILSKETPDHYTSANNLNTVALCLFITYLEKFPKPSFRLSVCLQTLLQKVSPEDRLASR